MGLIWADRFGQLNPLTLLPGRKQADDIWPTRHSFSVYNQFVNQFIRDLKSNSQSYFRNICVGIAFNLEIQALNMSPHHILLILESGDIEYIYMISSIISTELPIQQEDPDLRSLVNNFNKHLHSHYYSLLAQ